VNFVFFSQRHSIKNLKNFQKQNSANSKNLTQNLKSHSTSIYDEALQKNESSQTNLIPYFKIDNNIKNEEKK